MFGNQYLINIKEINGLFDIINKPIKIIEEKFKSLPPDDIYGSDEYWYLILKQMERCLFEYISTCHILTYRLACIIEFIDWFKFSWPPGKNKSGFYIPPLIFPPTIIFN